MYLLDDIIAPFSSMLYFRRPRSVLTEILLIAAQFVLGPGQKPVYFMQIAAGLLVTPVSQTYSAREACH